MSQVSTAVRRDARRQPGPFVPQPRGRRVAREDREWLVHTRHVAAGAAQVWEAVTSPERLERWVGTWSRLPDVGRELLFTFEDDDLLPAVYRLVAYADGRSLTVSHRDAGADDHSEIRIDVVPVDEAADSGPRSVLTLTHAVSNRALAPHLAAGCEYYLDRLTRLLEGGCSHGAGRPTGIDFDAYFLAHAAYYRRLFPLG